MPDENREQNLTPNITEGQDGQQIPQEEAPLFYNVLPRESMRGPLVNAESSAQAVASVQTPEEVAADGAANNGDVPVPTSMPHSSGRRTKLIAIFAVILIILLAGVGFWYFKLRTTNNTEPLVSHIPTPTETKADETVAPTVQPEGVTTTSEWQKKYFNNEICQKVDVCGDAVDGEKDGLTNLEEFKAQTDPNNSDSDADGLSDGDEIHVFGSDPLLSKTVTDDQFNDADYARGGYDFVTKKKYTADQWVAIKKKVVEFPLHKPTIDVLTKDQLSRYTASDALEGVDLSAQATLSRDTSRLTTMQRIGTALLKYKQDKKAYPLSTDFSGMVIEVKPYNTIATNYNDPINKDQYVYTYESNSAGTDFTLGYYSETQQQVIKYKAADAEKDSAEEGSQINDDTRKNDLENIRSALLIYSAAKLDAQSTTLYVFPAADKYKTALVPQYLTSIPKDPVNAKDYEYKVSGKFDSFTLKATLENPEEGTTGYLCNQEECRNY